MNISSNTIYGVANDSLKVIDITTPAEPSLLGSFAVSFPTAYESYYLSGYLYVADKLNKQLKTYSVSNPSNITLVDTSLATTYNPRTVAGYQNKIYVGTGAGTSGDLIVYDLTNPAAPSLEQTQSLSQRSYEVYFHEAKIFSANLDGKLQIINVYQ